MHTISTLELLREQASSCTSCSLRASATAVTFGYGDPKSPVLVLSIGPDFIDDGSGITLCGADELLASHCVTCVNFTTCYAFHTGNTSRPLISKCLGYEEGSTNILPSSVTYNNHKLGGIISPGQIFDDALIALGIERNALFTSSVTLCKTPTGNPSPASISACSKHYKALIDIMAPKLIIALGAPAAHCFSAAPSPMNLLHGKRLEYNSIPVVPIYHPGRIISMMTDNNSGVNAAKWEFFNGLRYSFSLIDTSSIRKE